MRLQRCLPVLATSVVLLTGCGVAQTQFHPGIAARVGDDTITTKHVDEVTANYCTAVEKVSKGQPKSADQTAQPMRYLSHEFATDLIIKAAVSQLAEKYDVTPTSAYNGNLSTLKPQLVTLSDDQRDAVVEVIGDRAYAQDVLTSIGGLELAKTSSATATDDDKYAAGQKVLAAWVADHDVQVNPKYGVDLGSASQVDTDLSYPLGTTAKDGLLPQPKADYTDSLPDASVCLD